MKVGIDCHFLESIRQGTGTYTGNLVTGLAGIAPPTDVALLFARANRALVNQEPEVRFSQHRILEKSTPRNVLWGFERAGKDLQLDLIHSNYFSAFPRRTRSVVTIHDLLWFDHSAFFPRLDQWAYKAFTIPTLLTASRFICVSDATYNALKRISTKASRRAVRIYEGVSETFKPADPETRAAAKARLGLPEKYVLFVGRFAPIKNLLALGQVVERLREDKRFEDLELVLVGHPDPKYPNPRFDEWLSTSRDWVHRYKDIDTESLAGIYQNATLFYFASFGEGFGLPVLEAMACGAPVLTSSGTACAEIAGSAASLADPTNQDAIYEKALALMASPSLRQELRLAGLDRSKAFSWDKCAQETWELYQDTAR